MLVRFDDLRKLAIRESGDNPVDRRWLLWRK